MKSYKICKKCQKHKNQLNDFGICIYCAESLIQKNLFSSNITPKGTDEEGENKMKTNENKSKETKAAAPIHKVKVGSINVAVWENKGEKGTFQTITMERTYTKDNGKTFEHTNSLRKNDLPKAILALQKAYESLVINDEE